MPVSNMGLLTQTHIRHGQLAKNESFLNRGGALAEASFFSRERERRNITLSQKNQKFKKSKSFSIDLVDSLTV